ncbi:MAG: peptide ABC transporter substrate-binding protein, partial [Methylococcales bacterium]
MSLINSTLMRNIYLSVLALFLFSCDVSQLNNPYAEHEGDLSILYSSFSERPKHLDPAIAYSSNEYGFIAQIYEPPLQYHYLKRPYQLEPLTAINLPVISYFNQHNEKLEGDFLDSEIAYSDYLIEIKTGIQYQPHPAFDAKNHHLNPQQFAEISTLSDFSSQPSRELQAADYVYQIKRLAHPKIQSPIAEIMKTYILGFNEFSKTV